MSLTSLSGLLNITFLLRSNFRLGHQPLQPSLPQPSQTQAHSLHSTVELGNSGFVLEFCFILFFVKSFGLQEFAIAFSLNFSSNFSPFFAIAGLFVENTVFGGQSVMFYLHILMLTCRQDYGRITFLPLDLFFGRKHLSIFFNKS
jgi:hypothetical protein